MKYWIVAKTGFWMLCAHFIMARKVFQYPAPLNLCHSDFLPSESTLSSKNTVCQFFKTTVASDLRPFKNKIAPLWKFLRLLKEVNKTVWKKLTNWRKSWELEMDEPASPFGGMRLSIKIFLLLIRTLLATLIKWNKNLQKVTLFKKIFLVEMGHAIPKNKLHYVLSTTLVNDYSWLYLTNMFCMSI